MGCIKLKKVQSCQFPRKFEEGEICHFLNKIIPLTYIYATLGRVKLFVRNQLIWKGMARAFYIGTSFELISGWKQISIIREIIRILFIINKLC